MVEVCDVSIRQLGRERSQIVRFNRLLANAKVTVAEIIAEWSAGTTKAAAGRHVLAIEDTTELHFTTAPERRRGLGPNGRGNSFGFQVHPVLAIDADTSACLGLAGGSIWNRQGVAAVAHTKRPLSARESVRWIDAALQAKANLPTAQGITVVVDREADFYALLATLPAENLDFIVRVYNDRALATSKTLYATMAEWPEADRRTMELREGPNRSRRFVHFALRFGTVTICRPQGKHDPRLPTTISLQAIDVTEVGPLAGKTALHWRLLTTHALPNPHAAWQVVGWYGQRWHVEQLFRTMKQQGLHVEDSQLDDVDGLMKLAATATRAACMIIQLVQARDGRTAQGADVIFSAEELAVMPALVSKLEGKTAKQKNPHPPRSAAWAAWIVGRLGGWDGYSCSRPPGPITMRHGLVRLQAIALGFALQHVCMP
ncbi:MAG TPA: IS4 family transposase [Azonexus sp.]|nr:IS4 family transposase [Azonexus sp.]